MTKVMVTEEYLENTGDAIREKNGSSDLYTPAQFASAIRAIPTAEVDSKTITANGTYNASSDNLDGYDTVTVNVPNSYSSSDEGKVVSSGALVAQTSTTKNANGTYDTTTNNSVTVNVANSYTASDEGKVVSSGALVAQTSRSVTANGTYDTTTNNSVVVDVPTGGGSTLGTKTITQNGTYNASSDSLDGYSQVTVNVPSAQNATFSDSAPNSTSGRSDGDYHYQRIAYKDVLDLKALSSWTRASSVYSTGQKIRCLAATKAIGFWVYPSTSTVYLHLSAADGTDLVSKTLTNANTGKANLVLLDSPVQLNAGDEVVVWHSNNAAAGYYKSGSPSAADENFQYIETVYASGTNNFPSSTIANTYPVDLLTIDESGDGVVVGQWRLKSGTWEALE